MKTGPKPPATAAGQAVTFILTAMAAAIAAPSEAAPSRGQITLYCGGGATGSGGGWIVQADGVVLRIGRERPGDPKVLNRATVPRERVTRWHAILDASGFDSLPRGEASNMTCSLSRRSPSGEHVILWGGDRQLPETLRDVVEEISAGGRND